MAEKLVFGAVRRDGSDVGIKPLERFARALSGALSRPVHVFESPSYRALADGMIRGDVDVAWLPPIPFIALERRGGVVGLASQDRGGKSEFCSALVVRRESEMKTVEQVQGARAAWVDPFSASGYVVPRVELDERGIDPRVAFSAERFFGSHGAVVRAVRDGKADVGATYAVVDDGGTVTRGAWLDLAGGKDALRVLGTLGNIPGDVIGARPELPKPTRDATTQALLAMSADKTLRIFVRELFGSGELRSWNPAGYDRLRTQTALASAKGILEAEEHGYEPG